MVKLTIVGRVSDGLPLAQCPRYVNDEEENDNFSTYKQQGEFILKEISRAALPLTNMTIRVDHHCFNYIVENGICFMSLCDSSYPRKLVNYYLQELAKEYQKFDSRLIERITKPYSFVGFGSIIGNIRRHYVDTRTQTNLAKLNAKCQQNLDFMTEDLSQIVKRRNRSEMLDRITQAPEHISQIWGSKNLEIIALKWTPITILTFVGAILLWTSLIFRDDLAFAGF
ncbi:hypothetical protein ACH5RR_017099 [Cinchona calisaya]|uniref:Longin domain-containing protein n=1 Tax=Cinchona calisaya TaxID=153742 RepID=A0ABD3A173_9GENT